MNTGGTQGGTGVSTGLAPSFTLGCGTIGGSSVSENVTPMHLINKKVLAYGIKDVTRLTEEDEIFKKYHSNENGCEKRSDDSDEKISITVDELSSIIEGIVKAMK